MSHKEIAFIEELKALCKKHGATIEWDSVYYPGDSEDIRFELKSENMFRSLSMKDLAEYISTP